MKSSNVQCNIFNLLAKSIRRVIGNGKRKNQILGQIVEKLLVLLTNEVKPTWNFINLEGKGLSLIALLTMLGSFRIRHVFCLKDVTKQLVNSYEFMILKIQLFGLFWKRW